MGVVGYGLGGRVFHAPVISCVDGLALRAIVERTGDQAATAFPSAAIFRSYEEMIAAPGIDLVVISTPNVTHFDIARVALQAGKHVVIDKPMAVSVSEARELERIATQQGVVLSPFHNRRWDGDFLTVRRLIRENALGELNGFESHFDRYRPQSRPNSWREKPDPGSGLLFDLGPHLLDQAFVLFGIPASLSAELFFDRDGAVVDDGFDLYLKYPRCNVRLGAALGKKEIQPRFLLRGSTATFTKHGIDPQEAALKQGQRPANDGWGEEPESCWGELRSNSGAATQQRVETLRGDYRTYYRNIRDAILGRAELAVTPSDGARVIRAVELAMESARSNSAVPWS